MYREDLAGACSGGCISVALRGVVLGVKYTVGLPASPGIPGARMRSQGLLSGVLGDTGFEASLSASVAILLRVIAGWRVADEWARLPRLADQKPFTRGEPMRVLD